MSNVEFFCIYDTRTGRVKYMVKGMGLDLSLLFVLAMYSYGLT